MSSFGFLAAGLSKCYFIVWLTIGKKGYLFDSPIVWLKLLHFCHPDKHNYLCRFEKQDGVVLMATTRSLKQIDEALQRPGRMDRVFNLQRPTQAEREKILQIAAKETMDDELIDLVDWRKVIHHQIDVHYTFLFNKRCTFSC